MNETTDEPQSTPILGNDDAIQNAAFAVSPEVPPMADLPESTAGNTPTVSPWNSFDKRNINYERAVGWIAIAIVGLIMLIGITITGIAMWPDLWVFGIAASVCLFVIGSLIASNIWLPPLSHARAGWSCDARGFQVRKGIWWRKITSVPRSRVQHTDVHQGPMQRAYGLAKLSIHTAGTQNATIEVEGLCYEVAMQLRDALIEDRSFQDAV
jgi:uncharacterized protein